MRTIKSLFTRRVKAVLLLVSVFALMLVLGGCGDDRHRRHHHTPTPRGMRI